MNKNKKACPSGLPAGRQGRRGFTIIEILVIVAIIGILVSIILVSMLGSKEKAQDNSAFTSFKSVAAPAFMCLTGGPGAQLTNPPTENYNICNIPAVPDSNWPDLTKTSWKYADFSWCSPESSGELLPSLRGSYQDQVYGGDSVTGDFCFMMKNGEKYMWCTITGCRKQGF
jgi:prepilin-type N-terminal cleavage/methylation domain-containing protein